MTQQRFRPRYAIENQTLEGLYDVFDYEDGCIVSDKPLTFEAATAEASTMNAPPKADVVAPDAQQMSSWLSAMNIPPLPGISGVSVWREIRDESFEP